LETLTWNRKDAPEWAEVYTKIFPPYRLVIESYDKAQEAVKKNEVLAPQPVLCPELG
jgi:hypothetical protein